MIPDPTMRSGRATPRLGMTTGRFEETASGVVLVLADPVKRYQLEQVAFMDPTHGAAVDGASLPVRVWVRSAQGEVVQQGSIVLVGFVSGSYRQPVIIGSVIPVNRTGKLGAEPTTNDSNRARLRRAQLDGQGGVSAVAEVDLNNGAATMRATGPVSLEHGPDGEPNQVLVLDDGRVELTTPSATVLVSSDGDITITTSGTVRVDGGGAVQSVMQGETFLADHQTLWQALQVFFATCATATTAVQVAVAAGIALPFVIAYAAKISTSVAARSPWLSTTFRTD